MVMKGDVSVKCFIKALVTLFNVHMLLFVSLRLKQG